MDFRRSPGPTLHGKGSLDEVLWHPVQPILRTSSNGDCHIPGEVAPVNNCFYYTEFLSYIKTKFKKHDVETVREHSREEIKMMEKKIR